MAFLDNSGDIILDAVLTDTGRKRLARGDGSFRIANYAFGDDASGSAYYDLEILKTPVLEAFTNNMSSMKSKLISISRTNLLYLPILKVNNNPANTEYFAGGVAGALGGKNIFVVAVDQQTCWAFQGAFGANFAGGTSATDYDTANIYSGSLGVISGIGDTAIQKAKIRIDQGLDTSDIPPTFGLDADLVENQYIIEIDNRLGYLISPNSGRPSTPNYIDDDDIASYIITNADQGYLQDNISQELVSATAGGTEVIQGPRGTVLQFRIQSSIELQSSTYLFEKMGTTISHIATNQTNEVTGMGFQHHFIDTNVRVTGITTGYSIDIPIRFVKYDTDIT